MNEDTAEEACIAEVSCYNPSFPVTKLLTPFFQNFKEHPVNEDTAEEACIAKVSCYNPSFPGA